MAPGGRGGTAGSVKLGPSVKTEWVGAAPVGLSMVFELIVLSLWPLGNAKAVAARPRRRSGVYNLILERTLKDPGYITIRRYRRKKY